MKDNAVLAAADAVEHYQRGGDLPPGLLRRCERWRLNPGVLREVASIQAELDSQDEEEGADAEDDA